MPSKSRPSVYVVTPVYNRAAKTLEFLKSVEGSTYDNLHVIIVDDGSTDGTQEKIKHSFPQVTVLRSTGNLWWSGATNLGVRFALSEKADYIFTVNNDVAIAPTAISQTVESALKSPRSLIGSIIYDIRDKRSIWYYGAVFNRQMGIVEHRHGKLPPGPRLRESEWLTGMGTLIPAVCYEQAGLYNERDYPQYMGDMEFSLRAKAKGYRLLVDTKAKIYTDTESAWINSNDHQKSWKFIWDLFFSIRSPYWLKMRYKFYKKYWGSGWPKAYLKANAVVARGIIAPFVKAKLGRS